MSPDLNLSKGMVQVLQQDLWEATLLVKPVALGRRAVWVPLRRAVHGAVDQALRWIVTRAVDAALDAAVNGAVDLALPRAPSEGGGAS